MRIWILAGIVLIAAGGFVLFFGGSFTTDRTILAMGDMTVTAQERHPIRPWVAGLLLLAGVGVIVTGTRRVK